MQAQNRKTAATVPQLALRDDGWHAAGSRGSPDLTDLTNFNSRMKLDIHTSPRRGSMCFQSCTASVIHAKYTPEKVPSTPYPLPLPTGAASKAQQVGIGVVPESCERRSRV